MKVNYLKLDKPERLFGYQVVVVCRHGNGEQRRKHHKRRINKKWLKRYGVWSGQPLKKGQAMVSGGVLMVTRDDYLKIKAIMKKAKDTPYLSPISVANFDFDDVAKLADKLKITPEKQPFLYPYQVQPCDPIADDLLQDRMRPYPWIVRYGF